MLSLEAVDPRGEIGDRADVLWLRDLRLATGDAEAVERPGKEERILLADTEGAGSAATSD